MMNNIYIYIYIRWLYSEHTLRCNGLCTDLFSTETFFLKKAENLVSFEFYGFVSLTVQL
jgi:hypothetical protein